MTADFWMNLQSAYELDLARQQVGKAIERISRRRETAAEFQPIGTMKDG
jgi:plasmid maintenance system antidote protein VapI